MNSEVHLDEQLSCLSLIGLLDFLLDLLLLLFDDFVVVGVVDAVQELDLPLSVGQADGGSARASFFLASNKLGLNSIVSRKRVVSGQQESLCSLVQRVLIPLTLRLDRVFV